MNIEFQIMDWIQSIRTPLGMLSCFQSAFAQDTYGNGYSEKLTDMSARLGSVLTVNGDSYNSLP